MALTNYLVPLSNIPQSFLVNLAGVNYTLTVKWNDSPDAGWILDIADDAQNPVVCGLPLITGADVLDGLAYLGIQGSLVVYTNGDANAVPTLDNLGANSNLYFQTSVPNNGG